MLDRVIRKGEAFVYSRPVLRRFVRKYVSGAVPPSFRNLVGRVQQRRRRRANADFTTGKVAVGEWNFGGEIPDDWITLDRQRADFNCDLEQCPRFPFADGSQEILYSSHMVEHLSERALAHFLAESFRILMPGRFIKLASTTLDELGRWLYSLLTPEQQVSGGHINIIYFEKLSQKLQRAGFRDVRRVASGASQIPGVSFTGIERPRRAHYSVCVEAQKPA
jgi:hypothetical protein